MGLIAEGMAVFNNSLGMLKGHGYLYPILFFILYVIVIKVLLLIAEKVMIKLATKTKTDLDDKLIEECRTPVFILLLLIGVAISINSLSIEDKWMYYINNGLKSVAILYIGVLIYRIINVFVANYGEKIAKRTKTDWDDQLFPFLESIIRLAVLTLVLFQILQLWNIKVTPLLASAGVAGFAIALASQELIKNFFGGVSIFADRNLKIGDRIKLGDKILRVEEIGIRSTKFLTLDNTLLIVPNSELANSKIENLSAPYDINKKVKFEVGVAYGSDPEKIKRVIIDEMKKNKNIIAGTSKVFMTEMGDYALKFLVIGEVAKFEDIFTTKTQLIEAIYKRFNKEGIAIPFPTYSVYLEKGNKGKEDDDE